MQIVSFIGLTEFFILLVIGGLGTAFWIWALVDSGRRLGLGDRGQLGWVVAIALTHALGALAYLLFGRRKDSESG